MTSTISGGESMTDKRLTLRLTEYWNRLRKDLPLPQIEHFSPSTLEDVMGKCCMWRVDIGGNNNNMLMYSSEYVGDELKEAIGSKLTGEVFSPRISQFPAARIMGKISHAVEDKTVVSDEGQFVHEDNRIIKYRSCLLPFGTRAGKVTNILLGVSWKKF